MTVDTVVCVPTIRLAVRIIGPAAGARGYRSRWVIGMKGWELPELPEVETMVRGIRKHVVNRTIRDVIACPNHCKPIQMRPGLSRLRRSLIGQQFVSVTRLGKRVVFRISGGGHLIIEPRMTGLMLLSDPPDVDHLRLRWDFEERDPYESLWFWDRRGLGTVSWFEQDEFEEIQKTLALGPDALEMSLELWISSCLRTAREIKVVLLDQKVVSGIGNLYASEILHRARIDPRSAANSLSKPALKRLAASVIQVLQLAVEYEGSTLGDGTYRNALNQSGRYQNEHRAYMRAGEPCLTCEKEVIHRIVQAQRSTFYCPRCQSH